ncbi:uncharacterized protein LOC142606371 [Castanea sativa]|uniref:uncharacterized protein LOC142606371 n=1 Tax=Castanea sativa TaxID=21020 RepID=UPI003F64FD72
MAAVNAIRLLDDSPYRSADQVLLPENPVVETQAEEKGEDSIDEEEGLESLESRELSRKVGKKKAFKGKKKPKAMMLDGIVQNKPKKIDRKMKKRFRKRARDYNSDNDERDVGSDGESEKEEEETEDMDVNGDYGVFNDEESGKIQPEITMFLEGSRAFKSIIMRYVLEDALGLVLSTHKKLIVEKKFQKVKGEAKKEKHLVGEKGHVKPANYLDLHKKLLIRVTTKGVVKLFNAVNKAQHAQKGLDPLRYKDAKGKGNESIEEQQGEGIVSKESIMLEGAHDVIVETNESAFDQPSMVHEDKHFAKMEKVDNIMLPMVQDKIMLIPHIDFVILEEFDRVEFKGHSSKGEENREGPAWAPLRDNYMVTNSKLKNWDKMRETTVADEYGRILEDSSSDGD